MDNEAGGMSGMNDNTNDSGAEARSFSQEEVDRIVSERLSRAKARSDKELAGLRRRFEEIDPDEYARLKAEAEEREALGDGPEDSGEPDSQGGRSLARLKKRLRSESERREREVGELESRLRKYELDDKVRNAALAAGVLPEDVEDVMKLTAHHFKWDQAGGIEVLDGQGEPTGQSEAEFFETTYRALRPKFYGARTTGGSGAPAAGGVWPAGGGESGRYAEALRAGDVSAAIALKRRMYEAKKGA